MNCPECSTTMKPLFTSWFCPNEENHKQKSTNKIDFSKIKKTSGQLHYFGFNKPAVPPPVQYKLGVNVISGWPIRGVFFSNFWECVNQGCTGIGDATSVGISPNWDMSMRCRKCGFGWKVEQ